MVYLGLLAFAATAREAGRAVLPLYRTRFSKHQFTQSQLLAIFCLMCHDDWMFRQTAVRLNERREPCQTLGLDTIPDFTTLHRFLQHLTEQTLNGCASLSTR